MTEYLVSRLLIVGMPISLAFKTVVFTILWVVLMLQRTETRLGIWINIFFGLHILMSSIFFMLTRYLVTRISENDYIMWGAEEWVLLIGLNIVPVLTATAAIMVVKWMMIGGIEDNAVVERQREQQEVLDETSLILAKRGKVISEAGIELDTRSIQMNADQREYDRTHPDPGEGDTSG